MARKRSGWASADRADGDDRRGQALSRAQPGAADESAGSPSLRAVLAVTALVAVALASVCLGVLPGRMYVRASVSGGQADAAPLVACVYGGDVAALLTDGRPSNDPQALAAVTLRPDEEAQVTGLPRGTYTIAIVGLRGSFSPAAGIFVTELSGSDTHVGFAICRE